MRRRADQGARRPARGRPGRRRPRRLRQAHRIPRAAGAALGLAVGPGQASTTTPATPTSSGCTPGSARRIPRAEPQPRSCTATTASTTRCSTPRTPTKVRRRARLGDVHARRPAQRRGADVRVPPPDVRLRARRRRVGVAADPVGRRPGAEVLAAPPVSHLAHWDFYMALAYFKLAIIAAGIAVPRPDGRRWPTTATRSARPSLR